MARTVTYKIAALLAVTSIAPAFSQSAATNPASKLFTTYSLVSPSQINWTTCGSTGTNSGCFGSGTLGSLTNACAIIESLPHVANNSPTNFVVIRHVFVMDAGTTTAGGTNLNVYKKTDTVANGFDTTTFKLSARIALPLTGGAVKCFLARNAAALFLGTDQSQNAAKVAIPFLQVSTIPSFSPPINVSQITASDSGFVDVGFGTGPETGFIIFGPSGGAEEDGGGSQFVINNVQGIQLTP